MSTVSTCICYKIVSTFSLYLQWWVIHKQRQITQSHLRLTSTVLKCFTKFMTVTQDNRPSSKTDRYRSDLTCKNTPGEVWDRAPPLPVNPTVSNAARAAGRVCRNIQGPTSLNTHNQPSQTSLQNEKNCEEQICMLLQKLHKNFVVPRYTKRANLASGNNNLDSYLHCCSQCICCLISDHAPAIHQCSYNPINWKESVTKGSAKLTSLQDASLTAKRSTHGWKTVLRSILLADSQSENSLLDYHQETSLSEAEIGQKFTQPKQTPATIKVRHG